jgi:putative ABC transport system permease protein
MWRNYFIIALRNLRKTPLYSGLNIFGLALGVAACLLILLFVQHELRYDRWNPQAEWIVRPATDINFGGNHYELAVVSAVLAPEAAQVLPEIQAWCRFRGYGSYLVRRDGSAEQNIREAAVLTVDSSFFELFPLEVIEGDPRRCLARPKTLALSRSRAEKYFSSPQMAMGQTLVLENNERWEVAAVFEDMPVNSHFRADLLLAMNGNEEVKNAPPYWVTNNNFHTYFLLREGTDLEAFRSKFGQLAAEKTAVAVHELLGTTVEEVAATGQHIRYYLQNLTDIHLRSDLIPELAANGNIRYVWVFSAIAAFILFIACINFMNLSTARSAGRAREVGMRKVLGSSRKQLIGQFLAESLIISALAVGLAVAIAALALPWYRELAGRELAIPWGSPLFWPALAGGALVVGLLAGSYPAFFLSAYDALKVLKGQVISLRRGGGFRSALVVFQFTVSVVLIISTLLVYSQLSYMRGKDLGFEKSQVIILQDAYALGDKIYQLKQEMLQHPAVESATVSGYLPVPSSRNDQLFSKNRSMDKDNMVNMQRWQVDDDYVRTLGMEIVRGRYFDPARVADSLAVILNETAVGLFGFDDPIGKKIYAFSPDQQELPRPEDFNEFEIIGVVKDFHWASLRDNIGALSLHLGHSTGLASFRYQGAATASVIAALETSWNGFSAQQPFSYIFLDDSFAQVYAADQQLGKIAGIFGLLSVLVSCLGLFGLALYTAEQRTKEIGIRKVLGASAIGITSMLAKDFIKLVLIAIAIASPLAYWAMSRWLADFAYRITIPWWMFALAGAIALAIAFLTVSVQSVRAALANPVDSLRSE